MDFSTVSKNLRDRGFAVQCFATSQEAAAYLDGQIDGKSVGFGGSITLEEMGMYDRLSKHNPSVLSHWHAPEGMSVPELRVASMKTDVYLCSANALAESGEIVNIDGTGNRVSSELFGHEKVYLVIGRNKIAASYDEAVWRARNVASPKNAHRMGVKTPCAEKADRCYDCKSPERICRALVVLWERVKSCKMEVILIDEDLGY